MASLKELTSGYIVPLQNPKPDAERFIATLMGKAQPERPPLIEYLIDPFVMRPILEELMGRKWVDPNPTQPDTVAAYLDNFIAFWEAMGYDFVRFEMALPFSFQTLLAHDTAPGTNKDRGWADQHRGPIMSREDFEAYKWPILEQFDWSWLEYINSHLPEGMGLISCHAGGVFEHLEYLMSYEGLALALFDDPDLVQAITDKLGELFVSFYKQLLKLDKLIAVFPGDDMGFKTGTLISPDDLRKYILPWHKRFAQLTHEAGLPYFLHSCGNILDLMEDFITDVKIDAKHSYEDVIISAPDFQVRYGDRIAVLGGIDVDILTRGTPDEVRAYVRGYIEQCHPRGRYAVGAGNSVPSYIPAINYLTMLDETLKYPG